MRPVLQTLAALAALGLIGAALVVTLGLYNVSARVGHLPGVSWALHTTYRNAVELRAPPAAAVPDLDVEMAALGARHYESACRFCHAAPGARQTGTARAMVPAPPHIEEAVTDWAPRHLFWIVKHGVKMSGMPHWPTAAREDDVWFLVAFLARVEEMDGPGYDELASPSGAAEDGRLAGCAICHARDGAGRDNPHIPRLDIQNRAYLAASLEAYRGGRRQSGIMRHAAADLSDDRIAALAEHYAAQAPRGTGETADPALLQEGRRLAAEAGGSDDVPVCDACHGASPSRRDPLFPSLAGQRRAYLLRQLELWRAGRRGGTDRAALMHEVVPELDKGEMRALAAYYAAQAPRKPAGR